VHDDIIHKRSLGIEQRRILRLPQRQFRRIVHRNVLHGRQCLRACEANIAHVADVEDAHSGADNHMFGDDSAANGRRIFDGHIPAVELDHLRAHLAMDGIQRGLPNLRRGGIFVRGRFNSRQA